VDPVCAPGQPCHRGGRESGKPTGTRPAYCPAVAASAGGSGAIGSGTNGAAVPAGGWPAVSVVMPVRDEERHLRDAVGRVLAQDYPGLLEVVLAVGPSGDRTAELAAALAGADPRVRVVANPSGATPAGLNAALRASAHPVVVRVDGHGLLSDGYVTRAVQELARTEAANVGGVMHAVGTTDFERAVARAMTSRLGIGGAVFHTGGTAGPADSVYLGVFRRDVLDELGGFDEHYRRAQDWELNLRIRRAGHTVWFDPDLSVTYRPRSGWGALSRQFAGSGRWRRELVRRHPDTASARYLAPPVVTVAVVAGSAVGIAGLLAGAAVERGERAGSDRRTHSSRSARWKRSARWGLALPAGYAAGVTAAAATLSGGLPARSRLLLAPVLATMHLSWGAGFLGRPPDGGPRDTSRDTPGPEGRQSTAHS